MADISGLLGKSMADLTPDSKKPAASLFDELGIYSPSEKIQQRLAQQQAQQAQFALQQQLLAQQQSQQLNIANSKANAPTGFNFSQFLASGGQQNLQQADQLGQQGVKALQGAGGMFSQNMQQPLASDPSDQAGIDPKKIILDAMAKYPKKSQALKVASAQISAMAQSNKDDPYLQNIAAQLDQKSTAAEKDEAELESKAATTAKTKIETNKAVSPGTPFNLHAPNGDIITQAENYNPDGTFKGYKTLGQGPNKQIVDNSGLTDTQVGANIDKFTNLVTNTDSTISAMRTIKENLQKGAAQGWTATGVSFFNNVKGTLEQLAGTGDYSSGAREALSKFSPTFQDWANRTGVTDSIWNDLVSNLAKTYNPTGTITEKDITRAAKTVGQNISNPSTVAAVLEDAERRSREFVDKTYKYSNKKVQEGVNDQYNAFLQSNSKGAEGPDDSNMTDEASAAANNQEPNWDNAPAGTPAPKNEKEYDALPKGTKYWNPYLKKVVPKK